MFYTGSNYWKNSNYFDCSNAKPYLNSKETIYAWDKDWGTIVDPTEICCELDGGEYKEEA